jgi:uncharacterized membrane protein
VNIKRIARHLVMTHWQVNRSFPHRTLLAIEKAIEASETAHCPLFQGQSARQRAINVFSQLRIWDTEHNNGVLIYVLLADREVEIVADRGIHAKAGPQEWGSICRKMEMRFKQKDYEGGVVSGIQAVTQHLLRHFPAAGGVRNELPNRPVKL